MERVLNLRAGLPVAVTSLDKNGGTFLTRVMNVMEDQIAIAVNASLNQGCLLTVETDNDWIMAEVRQCEPEAEGFRANLVVLESVNKLDLRKLRDAVYEGQAQTSPSLAAA